MYTNLKLPQPPKVSCIAVGGIVARQVMVVRELQLTNALLPMLVSLSGRVMEVRDLQSWNAPSPMLVSPVGRVMDARALQPLNALTPSIVTPCGNLTSLSGRPVVPSEYTSPAPPVSV